MWFQSQCIWSIWRLWNLQKIKLTTRTFFKLFNCIWTFLHHLTIPILNKIFFWIFVSYIRLTKFEFSNRNILNLRKINLVAYLYKYYSYFGDVSNLNNKMQVVCVTPPLYFVSWLPCPDGYIHSNSCKSLLNLQTLDWINFI